MTLRIGSLLVHATLLLPLTACGSPVEGTNASTGSETETDSSTTSPTEGTTAGPSGTTVNPTGPTGTDSESNSDPSDPTLTTTTTDPTDPSTSATSDPSSTGPVDTSTSDPTDASTSEPGTTTGIMSTSMMEAEADAESDPTGDELCQEFHKIPLAAADAELFGPWNVENSMLGEGEVLVYDGNPNQENGVLWTPQIPCEDTWHVWVRYLNSGQDDSYFAKVDGVPDDAAIFEGDCGWGQYGYYWAQLNWRELNAEPCEYVQDPWVFDWAPGEHSVAFGFRESPAIARVLIVNDADYVPNQDD